MESDCEQGYSPDPAKDMCVIGECLVSVCCYRKSREKGIKAVSRVSACVVTDCDE